MLMYNGPMHMYPLHRRDLARALLNQNPFHTGEWHAQKTAGNKLLETYELQDVTARWEGMHHWPMKGIETLVRPNLPWADQHLAERVGGEPLNPPPSHVNWPWAKHNAKHQDTDEKFSHTYPERFWPKFANRHEMKQEPTQGIRYAYGDLADVVNLLTRSPLTRQAYLPVWFPEDTGAVDGQRVPCTLGYHFMIRKGTTDHTLKMSTRYYIRSCDFIRHMDDDVYLTIGLIKWVCEQLRKNGVTVVSDSLTMHIGSLHAFVGDKVKLTSVAA